ncbi:ribosomal-protein-alanine N-acetyltransferase [Rubricella aquisinus]|uniref:Ribosomal-protein-alanine N-acetyltransferase n=1 Tax=Rubricella aquisinus TaxID=2028108 RepID=A0A840WQU6_9RHOB|nr:GNAT family protein [Rubricella aquisinus]MBB5516052.1 ribosomal-protein-alanine N-acetyltransferase [Rubricella aquisinus]
MLKAARATVEIRTARMLLRPPIMADHLDWARARKDNRAFIEPWEPVWATDHLTKNAFRNRVAWAKRSIRDGRALPLMMLRHDGRVIGAITLDNIRRGPAQMGTVGYWITEEHARQGLMTEALSALVDHAFHRMDLSRIEAACLPENAASRALLERCGFKYEGVAQSYLQIAGRWRNHVLYAQLRNDRRGRTDAQ